MDVIAQLGRVLLGSTVSGWLGWLSFSCSNGKNPFSVGLVAQLFQPASHWVETVEKETTENGWKSILLENVNRFNLIRFRLKRLIPIEHDLGPLHMIPINRAGSVTEMKLVSVHMATFSPLSEIPVGKTEISATLASPLSHMNTSRFF